MASDAAYRARLRPLVRLDVDLGPDVSFAPKPEPTNLFARRHADRVCFARTALCPATRSAQCHRACRNRKGHFAPFFSPDGLWVAFFAQSKLKKISADGGVPIILCDAALSFGASWGEDGNIIVALSIVGGLSRIPSAGGPPTSLTEVQSGEVHSPLAANPAEWQSCAVHRWHAAAGFDGASIEVMSLADHHRKTLVRGGTFGRYLPSGHLIYVNRGTLFAVPFDLDRLEVRGTPSPVLDRVGYNPQLGSAQFDFSRTGTLIFRSGEGEGDLLTVQWLDAAGKTQPLLAKAGFVLRPNLSPDGQRLAMTVIVGGNRTSGSTNGSGTR